MHAHADTSRLRLGELAHEIEGVQRKPAHIVACAKVERKAEADQNIPNKNRPYIGRVPCFIPTLASKTLYLLAEVANTSPKCLVAVLKAEPPHTGMGHLDLGRSRMHALITQAENIAALSARLAPDWR
jgi:hypothetical protein